MSRSRSRARQRRQRWEAALRAAVIRARNADARAVQAPDLTPGHGELWKLFCDIERAGLRVWDVARVIACTEDERVMIAQAIAPHLAGMTSGSVQRRQALRRDGRA